jgi:hypothetical protein
VRKPVKKAAKKLPKVAEKSIIDRRRRRPETEFRALTPFESLPPNHRTFMVDDDGSEPHLHRGEYAVVDTSDQEPAHGELYLIKSRSPVSDVSYIKQITSSQCNITGPGAADSQVWWICDLRGFRETNERIHGVRLMAGLSDGPYETESLKSVVIGRVVGFARTSLGRAPRRAVQS